MSEWQFSKSKFEERHINDDLWEVDERQRMNDDKYEKAFGYDLVSGNLKLKADDLSAEKIFGQQLEKRSLIDKNLLMSKIEQKYNEAFGNKTIWKLTKGKRADHAQNKLRLQDHMREEYETLIEKRNAESQDRMDYISIDMANQLALNYYTNDEKAALREWIIGIDADSVQYNEESQKFEITGKPDTISYAEQLTSDDVQERLAAYKSIFKVAATMDTNQLEYSSDSDFVSNFAKKYDVVCKLASVQVFIDKFKEEGGVAIDDNLCIADLEAKVELAKEYKRDYELRMQLISSPCYALLSTDDVKDFIAREKKGRDMSHVSTEFAGFMDIYKKLNDSSVGKRKDAAKALEDKIRAKRQQYAEADSQTVAKEIPGIQKLEEDQSTDALLMKCYNTKKIEYPEVGGDDYGVILNLPVELKIDKKYPPEMLKRLESNVAEAIRNKSFGGVELKPELHKEFEEKLAELARYKKSYYRMVKKAEYIRKLRAGLGCDINNPSFKDTHEARILNRLMAEGLFGETAEKNAEGGALSYMNKLVTLADSLDKQGLKAYKEAEEELIIRRNYIVSGPLVDPGSRMELFNVALRSTSQERIKELKGKQSVTKPGQVSNKLFFEIFKQRYEEKSLGLPEEKDAKLLSKEEWGQISWVMHQLVSKENIDENGIDDFKRLWDKKINYQASQNKPVSDRVRANVENLLESWRETLNEMSRRRQQLKEKAALNTQKLHRLKLQSDQPGNGEKRNKKHKRSLANGKRRNREDSSIISGNDAALKAEIEAQKANEEKLKGEYEARRGEKEKVSRDMAHWDEKIKGSYHHVLMLEDATKYQAFAHAWRTNDQIRERIIADKLRQERRDLYMEYTEEERKALRARKTYVLRKEEPQKKRERNNFGELYNNSIRDVEAVLRKMKANSYTELDRRRRSDDPKERTIELYHSEGTRLMEEEGHEVLEIDIGGSSYRELSHAQNGFLGYSEGDEYELHKQYGDKYFSKRNGKTMDHIRSKTRYGESEKAMGRKKTRFTIAGPTPTTGGILNAGEYSIENTTENILEIGSNYLEGIFKKWEAEQERYEKDKKGDDPSKNRPMVDVMLRGHSRGAVGSTMGEMKIKYWLHEKYPQYENMVKFHITQYDAVPGGPSDWGGYEKIDHTGTSHRVVGNYAAPSLMEKAVDNKYLPVGKDAETTAIYSMNTQYDSYFAAQEIRHARRLIFTPFNHAVGLDVESTDNSQMDQEGEKLHAMTFYDTTTNKAYRQTGLDHLGDGVYVMDEKHNLVKLNSVEEYVRIIQLTVPEPELKEQFTRHMSMLHAVASKFDMDDKEAEKLWNDNLKSEEVKKAADDWSVFDVENKVRSIATGTAESKKFQKAMTAALENRKKVHNDYIDKHVSDENTRKFLKVCTDVCFKVDRLCYGIFEANKFAEDSKAMDAAVEEFRKLKDSVKPEGMTEQELEIANAAEKSVTLHREVMDMLKSEYEEIV